MDWRRFRRTLKRISGAGDFSQDSRISIDGGCRMFSEANTKTSHAKRYRGAAVNLPLPQFDFYSSPMDGCAIACVSRCACCIADCCLLPGRATSQVWVRNRFSIHSGCIVPSGIWKDNYYRAKFLWTIRGDKRQTGDGSLPHARHDSTWPAVYRFGAAMRTSELLP